MSEAEIMQSDVVGRIAAREPESCEADGLGRTKDDVQHSTFPANCLQ